MSSTISKVSAQVDDSSPPIEKSADPKSTEVAPQNKEWNFTGDPSPIAMHTHAMHKKSITQYYSITTMSEPRATWAPLYLRPDMETRTCYRAGSRIHLLTCGHYVVVAHGAELCGTNCAHSLSTVSLSVSVPTPYAATIRKIRSSIITAVHAWKAAQENNGNKNAAAAAQMHVSILDKIWHKQNVALQPVALLLDGDFSCKLCGTQGERDTAPAMLLTKSPYFCIVTGRDAHDLAFIDQLRKGVMPQPPPSFEKKAQKAQVQETDAAPTLGDKAVNIGTKPSSAGPRPTGVTVSMAPKSATPAKKEHSSKKKKGFRHGCVGKMRRQEKQEALKKLKDKTVKK